ncbi:hypothetical protein PIB30_007341 [Stylosanthes scabra]|uniref:Jasmonate O-methyltransferase n=1 Tax=Stylosanthes scabra TaxID=79078 RepID=A0ABU6Y399_9FABA|nr:hypothetical protein [Stylosanthes scabra]
MNISDSTKRDSTDRLQMMLDAIRIRKDTVQSTSIMQQRRSANSAQSEGNQGQVDNVQVTQERVQERQEEIMLPTWDSEPQPERDTMEGDGSEMGKGRPTLKATTIDEFLKENGIDVDLDGISTSQTITEQHGDDVVDSMALYENYYQYVMAESEYDKGNISDLITGHTKKKKTRGHTSFAEIYARTMEQREEVTFDIGGPVGPTAQIASNLTSFVGTIGRNKRFVSLLYTNWHVVPWNSKNFMWRYFNTKFILPASAEKWVIQTIRDAWKRFKGKLKLKHFEPYDNFDDIVKNRPQREPEDQFIKLLLYWSHPTIQAMCQRNKKNKEQQKFSHRMGPVNFARVREAMVFMKRKSKATNEEPQQFEVFIATRTSRKRKELDEGTQTAIKIFRSRQASGESEEEAFRSIFGKEQPSRVRCYVRSVTKTDLQRHPEISSLKQHHQEEVTTLKSELGDMKTQQHVQAEEIQQQAQEIQGLRSMVKLLILRSEPDLRPEEVDAMMQHGQHSPIDANSGHGSHHVRNVSTSFSLEGLLQEIVPNPKKRIEVAKMQTVEEVFHMNKGVGETSYAMNSDVQNNIISVGKEATKKGIVQALCSSNKWPEKIAIADLGCSSGPNALRVISEIIDAIFATSCLLDRPAPELVVHLNDLFGNDFNTIFESLPSFYKKMNNNNNNNNNGSNCFVFGVPGSFYGRLFPSNSLHFVHSSSSLHWLSQVPGDILEGRVLNKGKLYISKSSPERVLNAYSMQFKNDFLNFMELRSQELVAGGCMVLSFMGRNSLDPAEPHACYQWELLAQALMTMVEEGLVEEEKVDSFDAPYYAPCIEEIKWVLQKEGSFILESYEAYEIDWDGGCEFHSDSFKVLSCGERVSRTIRAVVESMLESHFGIGSHIMDELFLRYGQLVDHHLKNNRTKYINLVLSLVKH